MNRLISANFARLWRSRVFYLMESFMAGYCALFYRDVYLTIYVNHKAYRNWNLGFFGGLLPIGIVLAFFVSFYIGAEYGSGAIRNKIATGHLRLHIYLANLIVCYAAAVIAFVTYFATAFILGSLFVGKEAVNGIHNPGWGIVMAFCILMVYTAVWVFVAMSDMNVARVGAVTLLCSMLLLAAGIAVVQFLEMPEYTVRLEKVEDVSGEEKTVERTVYNSRYLTGAKRNAYEVAKLLLPSAQIIDVMNIETEYDAKQPLCLLGETFVITGVGIWIFRRKDIK